MMISLSLILRLMKMSMTNIKVDDDEYKTNNKVDDENY